MDGFIKLGILGPNLLFQIINFLLVMFILNRLIYKPILDMFERRREQIRESLEEANQVREQAAAERARLEAQLAEERREGQKRLREAVSKSEEAAERRLSEAKKEAEVIVSKARSDAEQTRKDALVGLHGEVADLALSAAGKVLGEGIDESKHRSLIDSFLKNELGELA